MNKMKLQILDSNDTPLGAVPFETDHVTWAIRNSGFYGRVTEGVIAQYIAKMILQAGENWERQKVEWIKKNVADLYNPGDDMTVVNAQVDALVQRYLSWEPFDGFADDGTPVKPDMPK